MDTMGERKPAEANKTVKIAKKIAFANEKIKPNRKQTITAANAPIEEVQAQSAPIFNSSSIIAASTFSIFFSQEDLEKFCETCKCAYQVLNIIKQIIQVLK